ncbi:hypothetical protein, partial [Streptomyces sp. LS1784]|uniref:hypothetical protein n=1 Tax=Streptomyces sp. LS1784 TaxID=2851533 RepID=UPI001CCEFA18
MPPSDVEADGEGLPPATTSCRPLRRAAARYDELPGGPAGLAPPRTAPGNEHTRHPYPVRAGPG